MATANSMSRPAVAHMEKHPKGLYVLFATEMWERFSFYSMLALFTLYLQNPDEGFGWSAARATGLYANYLMFVYASPLIGGWLADKKLGYRKAVMIGGLFFMAGHGLLSIRSMPAVYAALTCLVIGNGLFQAQRLHDGRQPLSGRQPPQRSRLQHLLHGNQHRRVSWRRS